MPLFIRVGRSIQFPTASKSGFGSPLSTGPTGIPKFKIPVPSAAGFGPLSVMPDGSVYLEYEVFNDSFTDNCCFFGTLSYNHQLVLMRIQSDGSNTSQTVKSYVCSGPWQNIGSTSTEPGCVAQFENLGSGPSNSRRSRGVLAPYSACVVTGTTRTTAQ